MVEEQPQLKPRNYMSTVSNASGAARAISETKNVAKGLSFSPFLQFDNQPKGKTKASDNLGNGGRPIMPKKLHSDFSNMQFGFTNVPWNSNGHTGRQSNNYGLRTNIYLDCDKGVSFAEDSGAKINSGFGIGQLMEYPSSISRDVGGSDSCISVVNGKIYESNYESSLPSDTSLGANILRGSNNVSSLGQENHFTPETSIPFEENLKGIPYLVSSCVSNQTPTLPVRQGINMDAYLLDENMRLLALTQILELSKQQHALYFRDMNQKHGRSSNISKLQHYMYEASTSEQGTSGASLDLPQNRGICGNPESTVGLEKLASLTGMNRYCCLSGLAPVPLHSKEKESQRKHSYDLQNEEPSLSLGINKDNTRSSACEKCSEQLSNICLGGKYPCAAQINCCRSNFFSGIQPLCYNLKQRLANASGETSLKMTSDLSRDLNTSKDENIHFEQGGKLDGQDLMKIGFHTPQWRDVPSKVRKAVCDATSLDQTDTGLDWEGQDGVQLGNISMKRFKRTIDMGDMSKEQDNSNVSSGCSAPVVTQASVDVNKIDSCTDDAVATGFVNNLVVDEGSGIHQAWLSDFAESERSDEFLGSTCGSYLNNGYLRVLNDQPCHNLLDDLKRLDSLIWKKGRNQNHFVLSANCKTNHSQKVKKGLKGKKRKRNEMRILDSSLSSGFPSLLHKKNGEGAGILNSSSSLSKEMQMHSLSSLKRSSNKSSFVQSSNKQRHSAFSSKFLCCKNHPSKHQSYKIGFESQSNSDAEFNTLPGVSGTKKLKKDLTSDCFEHFQIQEPAYEEPENAKLRPFSCRKENAHRITKPIVCGKYGEISNGQLARGVQKPAKIVSLSKILKTSKRCMVHTNGKPRLTSKKKWKRLNIGTSSGHCCGNPGLKIKEDNETQNTVICNETNVDVSMEDLERGGKPPVYKGKKDAKAKRGDSVGNRADAPLKVKAKEIRKQRSINELTAKETKVTDMMNCAQDRERGLCSTKSRNSIQGHTSISIINSDAFCCVCRSSSNDKINCLLECSQCLIRVHQACYGVSTLPKKSPWCCRPCRTNSKNIVYPISISNIQFDFSVLI
ncbi:Bromodomain and PHD finger-containing protein 3 [Spatholobus suberectus]|nr:Bromodomain and PHD finger-containing protein 3 [Spatholobus suberectus]